MPKKIQIERPRVPLMFAVSTFYILDALKAEVQLNMRKMNKAHELLYADIIEYQNKFSRGLADTLFAYTVSALMGELRHFGRNSNSKYSGFFIDELRDDQDRYPSRDYCYSRALSYEPRSFLNTAERMFYMEEAWEGGYGGTKWGYIAHNAKRYYQVDAHSFCDLCFSISHNGSYYFDKQADFFEILVIDWSANHKSFLDDKFCGDAKLLIGKYIQYTGHSLRRLLKRAKNLGIIDIPSEIIGRKNGSLRNKNIHKYHLSEDYLLNFTPYTWGKKRFTNYCKDMEAEVIIPERRNVSNTKHISNDLRCGLVEDVSKFNMLTGKWEQSKYSDNLNTSNLLPTLKEGERIAVVNGANYISSSIDSGLCVFTCERVFYDYGVALISHKEESWVLPIEKCIPIEWVLKYRGQYKDWLEFDDDETVLESVYTLRQFARSKQIETISVGEWCSVGNSSATFVIGKMCVKGSELIGVGKSGNVRTYSYFMLNPWVVYVDWDEKTEPYKGFLSKGIVHLRNSKGVVYHIVHKDDGKTYTGSPVNGVSTRYYKLKRGYSDLIKGRGSVDKPKVTELWGDTWRAYRAKKYDNSKYDHNDKEGE